MRQKAWQIRLLVLQLLGTGCMVAFRYSEIADRPVDHPRWMFQFHSVAGSLLFPLGLCMLAYVLWALAVHIAGFSIRAGWLRAVLGAAGALPALYYTVGFFSYWMYWPCFRHAAHFYFILGTTWKLQNLTNLALICLSVLPLALAVETKKRA